MKKVIVPLMIVIAAIVLTACSGSHKKMQSPDPCALFSCNASIAYDDFSATALVQRYGDGAWSAEFSEPPTLSGVRLDFLDGETTASYKGLSFSVPKDAVPVKALIASLIEVFDEALKSDSIKGVAENGKITVSGSLSQGDYSIVFDESSGNLLSFEMPGSGLKMVFSDFDAKQTDTNTSTSITEAVTSVPQPEQIGENENAQTQIS